MEEAEFSVGISCRGEGALSTGVFEKGLGGMEILDK